MAPFASPLLFLLATMPACTLPTCQRVADETPGEPTLQSTDSSTDSSTDTVAVVDVHAADGTLLDAEIVRAAAYGPVTVAGHFEPDPCATRRRPPRGS